MNEEMRMNEKPEEKRAREEEVASFGGYEARQTYEKKNRHRPAPALVALYLLLFVLSAVGLISLLRGSLFTGNSDGVRSSDKVTLPTVSGSSDSKETNIESCEKYLITVEVRGEETVRGTGFLITEDGYAVCHESLFQKGSGTLSVYTGSDTAVSAEKVGQIPSLGIAVIRLDPRYSYHRILLGTSSVHRGQTLYGVSSVTRDVFYGLTAQGIAVSTAENAGVLVGEEERIVPVLYTSIPYDETLNGALVVSGEGNAVGFLTNTLAGRGGGMTAVPIVTLVGLVNEIIN